MFSNTKASVLKYEIFFFHASLRGNQIYTLMSNLVSLSYEVTCIQYSILLLLGLLHILSQSRGYSGRFLRPMMLSTRIRRATSMWCVQRPFSAPFLFFCLCFFSNICLSFLIIYFITTSRLSTLITNTMLSHSHSTAKRQLSKLVADAVFLIISFIPNNVVKT